MHEPVSILDQNPLPLSQAAALIPGRDGQSTCHVSCLLRWLLKGVKLPGGQRVKLRGARIGGRWFTSQQALEEFIHATTPGLGDATPRPAPRSASKRRKASEAAERELEALGV